MASKSILTPLQKEVLHGLFEAGLGDRGYFLTGGTALAEFYLKHRLSDDLDFFTRKGLGAPDSDVISPDLDLVRKTFDNLGLESEEVRQSKGFVRYFLHRQERSEKLKVEFVSEPHPMVAPPRREGRLRIDSLEDIARNKVCAISDRGPDEPKHLCDLYFILKETAFTLDHLIRQASEKDAYLDGEDGQLALATTLLRVEEARFDDLKMIRPLERERLRSLFVLEGEAIIRRLRPEAERGH